jgi:hypothetical protein
LEKIEDMAVRLKCDTFVWDPLFFKELNFLFEDVFVE